MVRVPAMTLRAPSQTRSAVPTARTVSTTSMKRVSVW